MVSAHWTTPVMTPVMLGQYWGGGVRKRVYAPADFHSPAATDEASILEKFVSFFGDGNISAQLGSCRRGLDLMSFYQEL